MSIWRFSSGLLTLAVMALGGCGGPPGIHVPSSTRVRSTDKAANVLVSPTMVAPWADVSASLKPAFTMTGDTAATQVLPVTEQIQTQVLSAFGFSLGLGLPGSSTSSSAAKTLSSAFGSNTADGKTTDTSSNSGTTTSTTTTTTVPGTAPAAPTGIPAGGALPAVTAPSGALGLDPVLRYKAANYLNQEVQLLNQEIDNVASRQCFVPYIVKLKIAVMTYRPSLGYSIHTRASFFNGSEGMSPPTNGEASRAARILAAIDANTTTDGVPAATPKQRDAAAAAMKVVQAAHIDQSCLQSDHVPVVVPLLVADDMEVALKSRTAEAAQQIGLALNFMLHGVGANAAANNVRQSLAAIASQQFSSALTISRDNDNTLYIHIEPTNQASGDPDLVGQTYDVAVLMLVPRMYFEWDRGGPAPAQMSLVTYTQFRDAKTGALLPSRPATEELASVDRVIEPYLRGDDLKRWKGRKPDERVAAADQLTNAIVAGNFADFQQHFSVDGWCSPNKDTRDQEEADTTAKVLADIQSSTDTTTQAQKVTQEIEAFRQHYSATVTFPPELCLNASTAPALWSGLSSIISDRQYKSASFQAPVPTRVTIPVQNLLASDDKSHPFQVAIAGVGGTSTTTLSAHLEVVTTRHARTPAAISSTVFVPAQTLALDTTSHILTLTFPSLAKAGLAASPTKLVAAKDDDGGATMDIGNVQNAVVVEQVDCDPGRRLCPVVGSTADSTASGPVRLPVQFVAAPKATPTPVVTLASAGGNIIIAPGGGGTLTIAITSIPSGESAALNVTGAPVVAAPSPLTFGKNGYTTSTIGTYALTLANLKPGDTITLSAQAYKADKKTADGDPTTATFTAIADLSLHIK